MSLSLQEFVKRWKINSLSERAGAQSHFIDLCDMLGQPHPAAADAVGERYTYEKPVPKVYGGKGFADVWLRDHFAWEYKGKHKDLKAAYKQINDYREDLGNPPLLVVCDFDRFEVHTNFTSTQKRVYAFNLDELGRNQPTAACPLPPLEVLRALFGDTNVLRPDRTDAHVTQEAARVFSRLAERLEIEKRSHTGSPIHTREEIAHFLMRLLFCLFADSIGLLPKHLFRNLIQSDDRFLPKKFLRKLKLLFQAMSEPDGIFGEHTIRYFNGGLFDSSSIIELDTTDLGILYEVSKNYNWAHVAPEIFGTLFERSLNAERRSLIGAHYTSAADILLLIEPVLMRPLLRRWEQVKSNVLATLYPTRNAVILSEGPQGGPQSKDPGGPGTTTAVQTFSATGPAAPLTANPGAPSSAQTSESSAGTKVGPSQAPNAGTLLGPVVLSGASQSHRDAQSKDPGGSGTTTAVQTFSRSSASAHKPLSLLRSNPKAEAILAAWIDELTSVRVLDPACGSGNFLYLALRRMLDLWLEAQRFAAEHDISLVLPKMVSPSQLYGIETEFYAHELASIVVWIGFLQWKHEHGIIDDREPILQKLDNIQHADAILRYDESDKSEEYPNGRPYEPEWPQADFIIGNPPFLGDKKMKRELNTVEHPNYVKDLRTLYQGHVPGGADLVCYWFERANQQITHGLAKRAGLLATNSIRQGANRQVLDSLQNKIFMAWSDRKWLLEGAAVRVSMVGFDNGSETDRILDGDLVRVIHSDLTGDESFVSAVQLSENKNLCFLGLMKGGPFEIDEPTARKMLAAPLNPNGTHNSDVVKRRLIGSDILRRPSNGWIIDFSGMSVSQAAFYELPFEYVLHHVKPIRDHNDDRLMRTNWWLFGRTRPALKKSLVGLHRCIVTSEIAKYRLFVWMPTDVIPDHRLHVIARDDDYFIGTLQSRAHVQWSLRLGSTFEDRPSYNSDTIFLTFPFPWPPGTEPSEAGDPRVKAIADAARELVRLRDAWLNPPGASEADLKDRTLTRLYNKRPEWLANAHRTLDEAVFAAYGWPADLPDQEVLARLLALNHERAAHQSA